VAVVSQFIERKGHRVLLAAWPKIVAACPGARLLLFGRGPLESALKQQVADNGLQDSVIFAGFRGDLRNCIAHIDLLVHPALREGLGICLLEAQAAGVAVVAAASGGIPETVLDGVSGVLVAPGSTQALEDVIPTLLGDPRRLHALGEAGRTYMQEQFSVPVMVEANLRVYRDVLGIVSDP
jgi:glycosyltransferase involved in cell wall biosynthesis